MLAKNKTNTVLDYFCPMLSSKYTVKCLINCGEQGCVFVITKNNVTRALKIIHLTNADNKAMCKQEVRTTYLAGKKGITVRVYHLTTKRLFYITKRKKFGEKFGVFLMDIIDETLLDLAAQNNAFVLSVVVTPLLRSIMKLKEMRIIHTDLRFDNIGVRYNKNRKALSLKKIDFGLVVSYDQALEIYRDIFKTTQVTEQVTKYFYMIDLEDLEYFYYDTVKMKLKDRVIDFLKEYTQNVESYEMLRNYRYNQRLTNEQKLYIDNKFPYPMNYQIKKIMNFIICACVVISRLVCLGRTLP